MLRSLRQPHALARGCQPDRPGRVERTGRNGSIVRPRSRRVQRLPHLLVRNDGRHRLQGRHSFEQRVEFQPSEQLLQPVALQLVWQDLRGMDVDRRIPVEAGQPSRKQGDLHVLAQQLLPLGPRHLVDVPEHPVQVPELLQ